jgi:hypothetical protein
MKTMMRRLTLASVILSSACIGARVFAGPSIDPAVTYTSTSTLFDSRAFTLGYEFTLSSTVTVDALGYWVDGNGDDHDVGIWDSTGTLLASTTVLSTDPVVSDFAWDPISDLILGPGTYTIGGQLNQTVSGNDFPADAEGISTIPGFTWVADEQVEGPGLVFPTESTGGYGNDGILTVDFSVTSSGSVPDGASTLELVGGAIFALGAIRRKFRQA